MSRDDTTKEKVISATIAALDFGIGASDGDGYYMTGFRNGLRYAKSLIDGSQEPEYEDVKYGEWIHFAQSDDCSICGYSTGKYESPSKYCPNCGRRMKSERR